MEIELEIVKDFDFSYFNEKNSLFDEKEKYKKRRKIKR